MVLTLIRDDFKDDGIFGSLLDEDVEWCVTMEHSYNDLPKIPEGTYTCVRGTHELENGVPFETFMVTGVPGHDGLLFHKGNFDKDSKGCILVGTARQADIIINSGVAFTRFMNLLQGINEFQLVVKRFG